MGLKLHTYLVTHTLAVEVVARDENDARTISFHDFPQNAESWDIQVEEKDE